MYTGSYQRIFCPRRTQFAAWWHEGKQHSNSTAVNLADRQRYSVQTSGFGRFNGMAAIQAFTQTKAITMHEPHALPIAYMK
jgi:hypothetical protein